jgi:hypothetical protein
VGTERPCTQVELNDGGNYVYRPVSPEKLWAFDEVEIEREAFQHLGNIASYPRQGI